MEKRSRYYLTREAAQSIWDLGPRSNDRSNQRRRTETLWFAEERKRTMQMSSEVQGDNISAKLERLKLQAELLIGSARFGLKTLLTRVPYGLKDIDRVVESDLGKIGVH